jgi:putative FmdB family regulatory protein
MPLYDLKCTNPDCGYEYEDQISLKDAENIKCPQCQKKVERLITAHVPTHVSWSKWQIGK